MQTQTQPPTAETRTSNVELLNKDELAARLGIGRRGVDYLVKGRRIPFIRLGHKTLRFSWARVEAALAKFETKAVA